MQWNMNNEAALTFMLLFCTIRKTTSNTCTVGCILKDNLPCKIKEEIYCPNYGIANPGEWPGEPENLKVSVYTEYDKKADECLPRLNISWTPPNDGSRKFVEGFSLRQISLGRNANYRTCVYFDLTMANWSIMDNRENLTYQYNCVPMIAEEVQIIVQSLPMSPMKQKPNRVTERKKALKFLTVSGTCVLPTTQPPRLSTKKLTKANTQVPSTLASSRRISEKPPTVVSHQDVYWTPELIAILTGLLALCTLLIVFAVVLISRIQKRRATGFQALNNVPVESGDSEQSLASQPTGLSMVHDMTDDVDSLGSNMTGLIQQMNSNFDDYHN